MLNDRERKTLREIQHQLSVDDPDFERSFRAVALPPPGHRRLAYTAVIVLAALLGIVMLLAGSPGGALAFAAIVGLAWFAQHRRHGLPPAERRAHR